MRRRVVSGAIEGVLRGLSAAAAATPLARPERHGVEVIRSVPYCDTWTEAHRLDIYRPIDWPAPRPAVLYVHGGGFTMLSKDTHWPMALMFARRGYLVFNVNYRLAPRYPFPAAVQDACAAYGWLCRHGPDFGADLSQLVLAGESSGANLVTALTLAACYRRPEPFARTVWDLGVTPRVVVAACGLLQVSGTERFSARCSGLRSWLGDRLTAVTRAYLRGCSERPDGGSGPASLDLADPLVTLEGGDRPARELPAFFAPVGTADPIVDDTRRLKRALDRLGVVCEPRYYEGAPHAFMALLWQRRARRCWQDIHAFVEAHLGAR